MKNGLDAPGADSPSHVSSRVHTLVLNVILGMCEACYLTSRFIEGWPRMKGTSQRDVRESGMKRKNKRYSLVGINCQCGSPVDANIASLASHYMTAHNSEKDVAVIWARKELQRVRNQMKSMELKQIL